MAQTAAECRHESDLSKSNDGIDASERHWTWLSSGALALALMEAACIFFVSVYGLATSLGLGALAITWGSEVHSAPVRLPLLAVATAGALLSLWLVWNRWRLRSAPAARWRKKPLSRRERLRISFILAVSVLTLLVVGRELYLHHVQHGSAFAEDSYVSLRISG